jgi:hypothetical protein
MTATVTRRGRRAALRHDERLVDPPCRQRPAGDLRDDNDPGLPPWPRDLAHREQEISDGLVHLDRLAIDGGPLTEPPRGRPGTIRTALLMLAFAALVMGAWYEIPML